MKKIIFLILALALTVPGQAHAAKKVFGPYTTIPSDVMNGLQNHHHDGVNEDGHMDKINLTDGAEVAGTLPRANQDMPSISFGPTAPAAGTGDTGDVVYNTTPLNEGGPAGWVRLENGTWRAFGLMTNTGGIPVGDAHYISPFGNNSSAGSISAPWRTVDHASAQLSPGDTLYARGGTYTGQGGYNWHSAGTAAAPITFKAYPGEVPVFTGMSSTQSGGLVMNTGGGNGTVAYLIIDGITFEDYETEFGDGAINLGNVHDITVQNCTIRDNGTTDSDHAIYLSNAAYNITIRNNYLNGNYGAGVHIWHGVGGHVHDVSIYNNVFEGGKWAVIAGDGATTLDIYNNTCYNQTDSVFNFRYAGEGDGAGSYVHAVTVRNNIINQGGSSIWGMYVATQNIGEVVSDYNLWYNNWADVHWDASNYTLAQYVAATTNEDHGVGTSPLFVGGGDYHLQDTSPAINAGATITSVTTDRDLVGRPQGAAYDIGAYEWH